MKSFEYELNSLYKGIYASARDMALGKDISKLPYLFAACKNQTIRLLHERGFDTGAKDGFPPPIPYPEPQPRPIAGPKPEELEHTLHHMQKVLTELGMNKTKAHSVATELMHQVIKEIHK